MTRDAFNPLQPRGTNGRWVRIGRGELEKMIDALAEPRARHIAEVNGKGGDEKHIAVVRRDIKARVLKNVRAAPAYHVKLSNGVEAPGETPVIEIEAKGDSRPGVIARIPEVKRRGNVDARRRGGRKPKDEDVVNKAQLQDVAPNTMDIKNAMQKGLPSGVPAYAIRGLTEPAREAARRKRVDREQRRAAGLDQAAPDTVPGGNVHQERVLEAALAAKGIKKAQKDRLRAWMTRNPAKGSGEDPLEYWERQKGRMVVPRAAKADRDAVDAIINFLEGPEGDLPGAKKGGASAANAPAAPAAPGIDPAVADIIDAKVNGFNGIKRRQDLRALFRRDPRKPGEGLHEYVARVRQGNRVHLAAGGQMLADMRAVRAEARVRANRVGGARQQRAAQAGGGARMRQAGLNALAKGKITPVSEALTEAEKKMINGDVTDVVTQGGGVQDTFRGKIGGQKAVIKPVAGERPGIRGDALPDGGSAARERAAYLVGVELGMDNVPPVIVREIPNAGHSACLAFIDRAASFVKPGSAGRASEDERALALLDNVIGNTDRHSGNVIHANGRIFHIDGGCAFPLLGSTYAWGNYAMAYKFRGKSLRPQERAALERMLNNQKLWDNLMNEVGLEDKAIEGAKRRIRQMLRDNKMLMVPTSRGEAREVVNPRNP